MIISLFFRSYVIKASFFLLFLILIAGIPTQANAGFFSNLVSGMLGKDQKAQVDQPSQPVVATPDDNSNNIIYNSQTIPLPESSINPDMKNAKDIKDIAIVGDEGLLSNNGSLGPATDLERYASSAKINIYKVKKGDTLEGIAKKFNISKDTLLYSNADLKEKDLLKIGQVLVILAIKDQTSKPIMNNEDTSDNSKNTDNSSDNTDTFSINTDLPSPSILTPTGQPTGVITDEYIWPFPEGVGRVSQGLHADQAYDFAAPKGTPIYAVENGTVLIAHPTGYNGGYGLYVVINFDDGRQAILGHMSKVVAKAGNVVKQGDIIGYVGSTGHSTGPHVHIGFHGTLPNPYLGLKINSTDLMIND
jgi:murein DD-endopeptidase MepM/ murein hydrolase activator NlpD